VHVAEGSVLIPDRSTLTINRARHLIVYAGHRIVVKPRHCRNVWVEISKASLSRILNGARVDLGIVNCMM